METAHLIAFNLALLAALASPGPALLIAIRSTLAGGRGPGFATGVGLALMASLWTLAALLGLNALFTLFPWAYTATKIAGALYLMWIAFIAWRNAGEPVAPTPQQNRRAFLSGLLVNLGNPKSVLFAAAVLVVIFPPDIGIAEKALVVGNHFLIECVAYGLIAHFFSRTVVRDRYLALKPILDRASALVLGALGLRLILDR